MLAIAVAQHFSIKEKNIIKSLESYYPKNNRSQVVQSKSNLIILDAYNANPSSMNEMINSFYKIKKESKVCILGDMGELGIFSKDEHEEIINLNKKLNLKTFYIGSEFRKLTKKNSFIDFMTDIENVRDISYQYSFWLVLLPFVSSFCYQLDGIFIGASQTQELRNAMFISVVIHLISSFILVEGFGNQGLWISLTIFLILRALTLVFYFNRIYLKI